MLVNRQIFSVEKLKKARRGQKDHSTLRGAKGAFSAPRAATSGTAANAKTVPPSTNSSATAAASSRKANAKELAESRAHLQALRVLQRNLVFVIGLSGRLTDPDVLKSKDYLGRFGKIIKAVVSKTTPSYAGSQVCTNSIIKVFLFWYSHKRFSLLAAERFSLRHIRAIRGRVSSASPHKEHARRRSRVRPSAPMFARHDQILHTVPERRSVHQITRRCLFFLSH